MRRIGRRAAAGKLVLQKCSQCGKVQFFPRVACVDCFGELDLDRVQGHGKDSQLYFGARPTQSRV